MVDSSFWLNLKVFQICLNNTYGLDPYPEIQKIVPGPGINHSGSTTLIESNHFPSCVLDLVKCPGGTGREGLEQCYTNSGGDPGLPCSTECLGGCTGLLPTQCTACRNMRWTGEGCKEKCPGLPWLSVGPPPLFDILWHESLLGFQSRRFLGAAQGISFPEPEIPNTVFFGAV